MSCTSLTALYQRCLDELSTDAPCEDGLASESWSQLIAKCEPRIRIWLQGASSGSNASWVEEDTDDLVQEVYFRLLTRSVFRGCSDGQLWSWIHCVARSVARDRQRDAVRVRRLFEGGPYESAVGTPMWGRRTAPTPEDRALDRERLVELLTESCRHISARHVPLARRVVHLAWIEGHSSREIARALGGRLSVMQVDAMLYRARRRLAAKGIRVAHRPRTLPAEARKHLGGPGRPSVRRSTVTRMGPAA